MKIVKGKNVAIPSSVKEISFAQSKEPVKDAEIDTTVSEKVWHFKKTCRK